MRRNRWAGLALAAMAPLAAMVPVAPSSAQTTSPFQLVYQTHFAKPDPSHWVPTDAPAGKHHWIPSQLTYGSSGLVIHVSQAKLGSGNHTWYGGALNFRFGQTYGEFSVTSSCSYGVTKCIALLWPDAKTWPPELDFEETFADDPLRDSNKWTDHYGPPGTNYMVAAHILGHYNELNTITVRWTPSAVTFFLNGKVTGRVTTSSRIPKIAMHLVLASNEQVTSTGKVIVPTHATTFRITDVKIYRYVG